MSLWLAGGRQPLRSQEESSRRSIAEVMAAYLRYAQKYYTKDHKPTSEVASIKLALCHVKSLHGRTSADRFNIVALKSVREAMIAEGLTPAMTEWVARCGRLNRALPPDR